MLHFKFLLIRMPGYQARKKWGIWECNSQEIWHARGKLQKSVMLAGNFSWRWKRALYSWCINSQMLICSLPVYEYIVF